MALITQKKKIYPVSEPFRDYLGRVGRQASIPVQYRDLLRYEDATPVYDKRRRDTLWQTVIFAASDRKEIDRALVRTYAALKVRGEDSLMDHLVTDRVDVCTYGNTQPLRVRIVNTLNDNFDYFYVKRADASRLYGLELEHLLSPNRIEFLFEGQTLVEEHIVGIPGDVFIRDYLSHAHLDEVRLAKEFVKFNERCFFRLLGDMHSGNFIVDMTPDFDETVYRLRAIDFDQQSYEPRCHVYLPQYYRENNPIIMLGVKYMTPQTVKQYQQEERMLLRKRARVEGERLGQLLDVMSGDELAPSGHVEQLRRELGRHHRDSRFDRCVSMGELVRTSLQLLSD